MLGTAGVFSEGGLEGPQGPQPVSGAFPAGRSLGCVERSLVRFTEKPWGRHPVLQTSRDPYALSSDASASDRKHRREVAGGA